MKLYIIMVAFLIAILCVVEGRPDASIYRSRIRKLKTEKTTTEAPTTKKPIKMIPKDEIKFVEPEKKEQQPLSMLYTSGEKKPLMRKFIPRAKPRPQAVIVSRRPLMKHREFTIVPTSPKPQPNKVDLFAPNKRKMLSPLQKSKQLEDNTPKPEDGDEYDQALNDDLMPAGSIKVYRKIIGNFRKRFNVKSTKPIRGKSKYSYYIFKANDIVLEPSAEAYFKRYVEKKSHDVNADEDKEEYIFVPKASAVTTTTDSLDLYTKPTQSITTKTVTEKINQQSTPSATKIINTNDILVRSTPNAEEIRMESVATSTSNYNLKKDKKVLMSSMPSVIPKANIEEQAQSSSDEAKEKNSNELSEAKDSGDKDSSFQTTQVDSTETNSEEASVQSAESVLNNDDKSDYMPSLSNEAKENNINDLSEQTTQTDPNKKDSDAVLEQSTPIAISNESKINDSVQSTSTSSTTTEAVSSDVSEGQTTPSSQTEAVGANVPQNLERIDLV